jgi:hypothetical protein
MHGARAIDDACEPSGVLQLLDQLVPMIRLRHETLTNGRPVASNDDEAGRVLSQFRVLGSCEGDAPKAVLDAAFAQVLGDGRVLVAGSDPVVE